MSRLLKEMPGLAHLLTPAVSPTPPPSAAPIIGLNPASLAFAATQGGSNPAGQTVMISNAGGGTLTWSASDNALWLTVSPASGTGNGPVTVNVATGTLTAGTYNGVITLSGSGASAVTVPVSFTVTAAAALNVSPINLGFTATQGAANPANQSVTVTSNSTWTVSENASWLSISPASGANNGSIVVSVNAAAAVAGSNTATISVAGGGISRSVAVALTLNAPSTSSATLTWNANTESDLAGYKIYRATASGAYGAPIATLQGGAATNFLATGLQSGTTYFFVVTAYDTAGNESPYSNEVSKSIF